MASRVRCVVTCLMSAALLLTTTSAHAADPGPAPIGFVDTQRIIAGYKESSGSQVEAYESKLSYYQKRLSEARRSGLSQAQLDELRSKFDADLRASKERIERFSDESRAKSSIYLAIGDVAQGYGIPYVIDQQAVLYGGYDLTNQVIASLPSGGSGKLISLDGVGQTATEMFSLRKGIAVFQFQHSGDSNFSVWLLSDQGDRKELLVNTVGDFQGSKGVGTEGGNFLLDVSADGPWSVSIEQPNPSKAEQTSSFTGQGQQLVGPFTLSNGLKRFRLSHSGSSNFSIWLLDAKGKRRELLVNEVGEFSGSKAIRVSTGVYYLDLSADGEWSVKVQ